MNRKLRTERDRGRTIESGNQLSHRLQLVKALATVTHSLYHFIQFLSLAYFISHILCDFHDGKMTYDDGNNSDGIDNVVV